MGLLYLTISNAMFGLVGMDHWLFSLAYDVFQYSNTDLMASQANMHPATLVKPMVLCWRLLVDL
jgi:hypothetical protein